MNKHKSSTLPLPARWILLAIISGPDRETLLGDFTEAYLTILQKKGRFRAACWILGQTLKSVPGFIRDSIYRSIDMFKNYLKIALRAVSRNKIYSFITIFSLVVGFTSFLLIVLYVWDEFRYDRYHVHASRIYRVYEELNLPGQKRRMAITPAPFGPVMQAELPQVAAAVRFLPGDFGGNEVLISHKDKSYYEDRWFFADESVFEVFSFSLIKGDQNSVLKAPYSVTLSESKAKSIFGDRDPVGQFITLENQWFKNDFLVTGIFKDIPQYSHFTFDFLASFASVEKRMGKSIDNWFNHMYYTYLLLHQGNEPEEVEKIFPELIKKHAGKMGQSILQPRLQALTSIRLHSHLEKEIQPNSDATYVFIFLTIAVFLIGIAAVNFINLSTARSAARAREVGMRKVIGARRSQIIRQFLGESLLFTVMAFFIALGFSSLTFPIFTSVMGTNISLDFLNVWWILPGLIIMVLLVGGLSGIYPAVYLSRFIPVKVIKGKQGNISRSFRLRKGLIVFQFTVSITLIVLTLGVINQLRFIQGKKLGFHKENVLVLPLRDDFVKNEYDTLKREMLQNSNVVNVSASSGLPGRTTHHWAVESEGWESSQERPSVWVMMVDFDFIPTMGMEILEGRDFSKELISDKGEAILINESARALFGWENPLEKRIKTENIEGRVVGIVKDFHFQSFRQAIEPLIIYIYPAHYSFLLVRIGNEDVQSGLASLRRTWKNILPNRPFEYFFLDRDFDRFYRAEQRAGKIFGGFASLAVIIALFGLYGLATFTAEQRSKELGIRKVLGASVSGLVRMLTSEFTRLVLLANIIAWPLAYFFMGKWLENFVYRSEISVWMFILAASFALGVALITVGIQSFRAASTQPIKVLRYE